MHATAAPVTTASASPVRHAMGRSGVGATRRFMPSKCDLARVYVDGETLFAGDTGLAVDELQAALVGAVSRGDPERTRKAFAVAVAHGITLASLAELSVCAFDKHRIVVAMAFDESRTKGPLDEGIRALLEASTGESVGVTHEQHVTAFTLSNGVLVLTETGILAAGLGKEDLESLAAAPREGTNGFEESSRFTFWLKYMENTPEAVTFTMLLGPEGYRVRSWSPPPDGMRDAFAKDGRATAAVLRDKLTSLVSKLPAADAKSPTATVSAVDVEAQDDHLLVSMTLAPTGLSHFARTLAKDGDALKKALAR